MWQVTTIDTSGAVDITPVYADYLKHEAGALVFKRENRFSYPEVVVMFAPGRWMEVRKDAAQ